MTLMVMLAPEGGWDVYLGMDVLAQFPTRELAQAASRRALSACGGGLLCTERPGSLVQRSALERCHGHSTAA